MSASASQLSPGPATPAPAVLPYLGSPPADTGSHFQASKIFTLAFFALALVICIILTLYIMVMLLRRRRQRFAQAGRTTEQAVGPDHLPSGQMEPRREIALIEGVLVSNPGGEEQVAYLDGSLKSRKLERNSGTLQEVVVDTGQCHQLPSEAL